MSYPVNVSGSVPEKSSRGTLLLRTFFGWAYVMVPHGFCLGFRSIATGFLSFLAFWAVLFTGKYPQKWFEFNVGTVRWANNVMAYMMYLTDTYPPFSGKLDKQAGFPVETVVPYPDKLSRGTLLLRAFFGAIYVGIPHGFILGLRMFVVELFTFIAFWAILFTGKYPAKMFGFVLNTLKWDTRVISYMAVFTDAYPPFNTKE